MITEAMLQTGEDETGQPVPLPPAIHSLMAEIVDLEEAGGCYGFYGLPNGATVHVCFPPVDKSRGHKVALTPAPVLPWHRSQQWTALITAADVVTYYLAPGTPTQYFNKIWFPVPMLGPVPYRPTLNAVKGKTGANLILVPSPVLLRARLEMVERTNVFETPIIPPKKADKGKGAKKK